MLLKKRKTEQLYFTPEQEACLANCRQLTNDELRVLNGGGSYKGMPSSVQMQQGLSGGSSNNDSSSSSGTSKGHNGMPSDVEAMLEHSGSSSATETSSNAGQTTVTTVAYPAQPATQPSAPKPTESEPAVNHGSSTASGSGSTNHSSSSASSSSTNNSSPSASTESGSSGNGNSSFPKPYAGAYEYGSYAEAQKEREEQKAQEVQDEQVPQADCFEVQNKGVRGFFKRMFGNDGKKTVHAAGNSISGTGGLISASAGYGLYLDSKNENLLSLSQTMMMTPAFRTAGASLFLLNIDELGLYANVDAGTGDALDIHIPFSLNQSLSGAATYTFSTFRSIDDMVEPYVSVGASFSVDRFSAGGDVILNFAGEPVGVTSSAGMNLCSVDKSVLVGLEAHARFGTTVVYPLIKNR